MSAMMDEQAFIRNQRKCEKQHLNYTSGELFCRAVFDFFLCWPPTSAGEKVALRCPESRLYYLYDKSRGPTMIYANETYATRYCGKNGHWLEENFKDYDPLGWTNYSACIPINPNIQAEYNRLMAETKLNMDANNEYINLTGSVVSAFMLILTFIICCVKHRKCRPKKRSFIEKNVIIAMSISPFSSLIYTPISMLGGSNPVKDTLNKGSSYAASSCGRYNFFQALGWSSTFMWLLIDAVHFHSLIGDKYIDNLSHLKDYAAIGWCVPVLYTLGWAKFASLYSTDTENDQYLIAIGIFYVCTNVYFTDLTCHLLLRCWYNSGPHLPLWIDQGPRFLINALSLLILFKILVNVKKKMRRNPSLYFMNLRHAVVSFIGMMCLLNAIFIMGIIEVTWERTSWKCTLWTYILTFLQSFQGSFAATFYLHISVMVFNAMKEIYTFNENNIRRNIAALRRLGARYARNASHLRSTSDLELPDIDPTMFNRPRCDPHVHDNRCEDTQSASVYESCGCPANPEVGDDSIQMVAPSVVTEVEIHHIECMESSFIEDVGQPLDSFMDGIDFSIV